MERLLIEGDLEGTYGITARKRRDKSISDVHGHAITRALAAAAFRYGWNLAQFEKALLETPAKGGNHVRNKAHRHGYDKGAKPYLERVWEGAQAFITSHPIIDRQGAVEDLVRLRERIGSLSWRGVSSNTALRLLMAHWEAARKSGGRTYTLSFREAAEIAGCTVGTAYDAVTRRLGGWLRLVHTGGDDKGSTWRLLDGPQDAVEAGGLDAGVVGRLMRLDAFAHRGLGSSSLKIIAALNLEDGQSLVDLADATCMSRATAYRHVRLLEGFGFLQGAGGSWWLTEAARTALQGQVEEFDRVAEQLGTAGTAQRRVDMHKLQRAVWLTETLPRLRERRMPDVQPVRGDEVPAELVRDGLVIDPVTGEVLEDFAVASDGRLILLEPELDYDELVRRAALACAA
ncbi:winged helix-turn-helix domain-containing protein [Streptomyces griseoaurantiacus]|uniref:winged helix-turn-helix domain-containing protein n=1 Tax=Streptomyces griseoaurantiacus TaxID=68213 RepID=UPI0036C989F9